MSDITANVVVSNPSQLFTMARSFKAVANGKIYIGQIDTDPLNPANQIPVYLENEDGSHVPVSQPIIINAGGYPVYNGQIAKFVTVEGHSMAIYDAYGSQQFYYPNVLKYDPDQLRQELAGPSGTDYIGYGDGTLTDYLQDTKKYQVKTIINVSAFGNTGTEQNGSDEAWNNAFAYARTICPMYTNPGGQSWYDLSGFEFVSDGDVYPKNTIKFRTTYGLTIKFPIKLPDDFIGEYAIDASADAGITPNRDPLYTKIHSNIDCRYMASGIYANGFLHFLYYGVLIKYLTYGVRTGTSGNEFILMPGSAILQRQYSANGDADFPAKVTTGTGVYIQSGDAKILGCVIAYYKLRGVRVDGPSCFIGAATHIYAAGRQSILQGSNGGNLNITACWLDSSFVQLDGGGVSVSNCSIYLTQSSDSAIGITCGASASNIKIFENSFLGWTGGTPVYFNKGVLTDKTISCYNNRYASGMQNSDVVTTLALTVIGESTAGSATVDPSSGFSVTYDGTYVRFSATARWSSFTGGTGAIGIYGLPFVADRITIMSMQQFTNNTNFAGCNAIKHTSGTSIRFVNSTGANVLANTSGVDNAYIVITGRYKPI